MNPLRVEIFYWNREEAEIAIKLKKVINACSHIPKDVNIIRRRSRIVYDAKSGGSE